MNQRSSSNTNSESLDASPDIPLCIICDEAACGVGPFSRKHLCQQHLAVDVADGRKLQRDVDEELRPYSENVSARVVALLEEQDDISMKLSEIERRFAASLQKLTEFKARVVSKLKARQVAVATCLMDLRDVVRYGREIREAEAAGNMAGVCELAMSMQLSVPDLQVEFEWAARTRLQSETTLVRSLRGLRKLQRILADWWVDDSSDKTNAEESVCFEKCSPTGNADSISLRHEVKLDDWIDWLSVCSDTSAFRGSCTGRVVSADSADAGSVALPQLCLVAKVNGQDNLAVLSVDGSIRMRCHCSDINWKDWITGLHGDRHLVFIAQAAVVTVVDLSGRMIRIIHTDIVGLDNIGGITGNAASVFVSSGNKIAALSKATGQLEMVITLAQLPHADLDNLVIHGNYLLVTDWKHYQVYRVHIDTQQVVATHPTQRTGLAQFEGLADVAIDSRGRLFVSEFLGHSVRVVAAEDGSLLWTLGVPGVSGSGSDRLDGPCGLVVVSGEPCEQLVVADAGNHRLLVLNLL